MIFSQIINTRFRSAVITLLTTLPIAACNTQDFSNAVAGAAVGDFSGSTNITATATGTNDGFDQDGSSQNDNSDSGSDDVPAFFTPSGGSPEPSTSGSNGSGSSGSSSTSNTPVSPGPVPNSGQAVAMYSYSPNLSNAKPLSGAVLKQTNVYLFYKNAEQYSSMRFYCCKGGSTGDKHRPSVSDYSAPYVYSVDLSQYSSSGSRELYVDATRANGSGYDSLSANFSINITSNSENTQPEPVVSNVKLSWIAPSEREDNSGISLSEIAGYKIYYGTQKGKYTKSVYVNDGSADSHTIKSLSQGTYYFVITTRDSDGRESKYSSVVTKTI